MQKESHKSVQLIWSNIIDVYTQWNLENERNSMVLLGNIDLNRLAIFSKISIFRYLVFILSISFVLLFLLHIWSLMYLELTVLPKNFPTEDFCCSYLYNFFIQVLLLLDVDLNCECAEEFDNFNTVVYEIRRGWRR